MANQPPISNHSNNKKVWLIRTHTNHLLGPVSKNKILELLGNELLRSNDEICHGNSFWFFIKENKYLMEYFDKDVAPPIWPGRKEKENDPISNVDDTQYIKINRPTEELNTIVPPPSPIAKDEEENIKKENEVNTKKALTEISKESNPKDSLDKRPEKKKITFDLITIIFLVILFLSLCLLIYQKHLIGKITSNIINFIPINKTFALNDFPYDPKAIKKKFLIQNQLRIPQVLLVL